MPKQSFKIQGFHGGLSSDSDPRDLRPAESPSLQDAGIDSVGRLKVLGKVDNGNIYHSGTASAGASTTITLQSDTASGDDDTYNNYTIVLTGGTGSAQENIITDYVGSSKVATVSSWSTNPDSTSTYEIRGDGNTIAISQNRGLFVMSSDRQLDGGSANETLIFCFDSGSNTIDIKDSEGWDASVITMDGATVPSYYAADGVVRVSDSTLTQTPEWFGYIADERFNGLASDSGSIAWTNVSQSLTAPTVGKCLMSTPAVGSDANGVNSSVSEYYGTAADASETQGDVLDAAAVNLRVGIQYNNLLPNLDANLISINTADNDDTTDLKPFIGNNNLELDTDDDDNYSGVSDSSIEYTIDDTQSFVIAFYITSSGSEYAYTDYVKVECGSNTSGGYAWTIPKADIKADCWNVVVCSKDTHDSAGTSVVDWGGTFTAWGLRLYQNSTATSASPDFYISGPVIAPSATIDGFQPGNYSFHYTWLYDDENKQESLPFKFSDVDNDDNTKDVNQIVIHKNPCLFNFDAYICPWSMSIAAVTDASDHQIDDTSHGLIVGDIVRFSGLSSTGGIDNNTDYYVSSQSLVANSFRVSTNLANAIAGTSINFTGSDDNPISYIYYKINKRISGSRLYWKVEENDNYFLVGELDFINKGFKWVPEGDSMDISLSNSSHSAYPILLKTVLAKEISPVSANIVDTFKTINGFSSEVKSLDAKYKTAVVQGRRAYVGNIEQSSKTHPDRILKSQVNRFDTFPEGMGAVDVAIRDGENIVKLEAFADRILQFKEHSLYIINVSENVDFLEDTYRNKGCAFDYHVTRTDVGIAWFNIHGVYLYDGRDLSDLLIKEGIRLISESDWEAFITDGVDGSADDTGMSSAMIGYIPKKKQILIKNENNDVYIYDFVLRAWTTGSGRIIESTAMTNFALDADQNLFYIDNTTTVRKTWQSSPQDSSNFIYVSPDIDLGEPGIRKKIYRVRLSYKGDADTLIIKYSVNGDTDTLKKFQGTNSSDGKASGVEDTTPLHAKTDLTVWHHAELKPLVSTEANSIYSFQLHMTGTVGSGFELNDITIIYRMKSIK